MVTKVRMVVTFVGHWLGGAFWGARDVHDLDLSVCDAGVRVCMCKLNGTGEVCTLYLVCM